MQIPLPTDNLYKFYCLFGLSIAVFFTGLLVTQYRSVNEEIYQANLITANAYVEISRLEILLDERDPLLTSGVNSGLLQPTKQVIPGKYPEHLLEIVYYVPIDRASAEMKATIKDVNNVLEKQAYAHVRAKFALERAKKLTNDLYQLLSISIVLIISGIIQYVQGLRLWLVRTQIPLDQKESEKTT